MPPGKLISIAEYEARIERLEGRMRHQAHIETMVKKDTESLHLAMMALRKISGMGGRPAQEAGKALNLISHYA